MAAQDWERLPDGQVLIDIKGARVALPTVGSDLDDIRLGPADFRYSMTLGKVIAAPAEARRLFAQEKQVFVTIPNLPDRPGLFLGRFDRNAYGPHMTFSLGIGVGVQNNCRAWEQIFDRYRARFVAEQRSPDAAGWMEHIDDRSPGQWMYVRAEDDPSLPKHFTSFSCGYFGQCTATSCIGEDRAFTYQFSRKWGPAWADAVRKAADVFRLVVVDK